ncbi:hypothetical protein PIB30_026131 [Stylosanthes scabra]|uniref:Uncharacterized protein n=1 Tax=Stylosanthes scabra TaxID=79078 RepID=A0ABU6UAN2_9FABA|nr:hypothetical protein [Stylosanthes scabra]
MGVSFPVVTFRAPSQHRRESPAAAAAGSRRAASRRKKTANASAAAVAERRRRWWQLCRDGDAGPASLGDFLEVERRFGDVEFYGAAAELEGIVAPAGHGQHRNGGRVLFADGRVLPPEANVDDDAAAAAAAGSLCNRFPVSLAGICSGGVG